MPCNLINFHNIADEHDLFNRVNALFDYVFNLCDPVYRAKWEIFLAKYHESLICPVNECKLGLYTCHERAVCKDRPIGYECRCKKHFEGDGLETCEEIDYCAEKGFCGQFATCTNKHPGYQCDCQTGYRMRDGKCLPKDPCKKANGGCSPYATCTSEIFGYEVNHQCECKEGFYGDGFSCNPINPCDQHNCDENADCVPYPGVVLTEADYNCECKSGYGGNGFVCEKVIDPCVDVTCGVNELANPIINSYGMQACECACSPGYIRVDDVCESSMRPSLSTY